MAYGHPITLAHGQRNPVQMAMEHVAWHSLLASLENKGEFRKFWSGVHTGYQKAKIYPSPPTLRSLLLHAPPPHQSEPASIKEIDGVDSEARSTSVEVDSLRVQLAHLSAEKEELLKKQADELAAAQKQTEVDIKGLIDEAVRQASLELSRKAEADIREREKRAKRAEKSAREASQNAERLFMQKTIEALDLDEDGLEMIGSIDSFGTFIKNLKSRSLSLTPSQKVRSLTPSTSSPHSAPSLSQKSRFQPSVSASSPVKQWLISRTIAGT